VGKTWSVKQFGSAAFESFVGIDLERNSDLRRVFEGNLQAKRIIADLEILVSQRIVPGKTLLFIDEIQACPRAITSLRYFLEGELPDEKLRFIPLYFAYSATGGKGTLQAAGT
jgi:hypothetical protein